MFEWFSRSNSRRERNLGKTGFQKRLLDEVVIISNVGKAKYSGKKVLRSYFWNRCNDFDS